MKEKELWMQKLKEKLGDYSEPMPASGWERLEKELLPPAEKRIIPYRRRWIVAAAAALLVAVSSVSLYFLDSPVADEMRHASAPTLATTPDVMPKQQEPELQVARTEQLTTPRTAAKHRMIAKSHSTVVTPDREEGNALIDLEQDKSAAKAERVSETPIVVDESEQATTEQQTKESSKNRQTRRPSGRDKLHLPQKASPDRGGRWSVGASVGNAGALSTGNSGLENTPISRLQMDMASTSNGIIKVPDGQTVVFKDGVPYLEDAKKITDITHHQPVSFGLSVRKGLKKGFSVEAGVAYTLLSSDVKQGGAGVVEDQKLHYVGIPLRANWSFLNKKLFTLYVSAGGAVEKCVYGELAGEKLTVNPLQFSLNGAVGAQINATSRVGIYIEPGVSYFFDDGSPVQTIRKDTPCNFNLQAGVRFTY